MLVDAPNLCKKKGLRTTKTRAEVERTLFSTSSPATMAVCYTNYFICFVFLGSLIYPSSADSNRRYGSIRLVLFHVTIAAEYSYICYTCMYRIVGFDWMLVRWKLFAWPVNLIRHHFRERMNHSNSINIQRRFTEPFYYLSPRSCFASN